MSLARAEKQYESNLNWDLIERSRFKSVKQFGKHLESCLATFYNIIEDVISVQRELDKYKAENELLQKCSQVKQRTQRSNQKDQLSSSVSSPEDIGTSIPKPDTANTKSTPIANNKVEKPNHDESVYEINGTPTSGRTSPIIGVRKHRSRLGKHFGENKPRNRTSFLTDCQTSVKAMVKLSTKNSKTTNTEGKRKDLKQTKLVRKSQKTSQVMDVSTFAAERFQQVLTSTEDDDIIQPSPTADCIKKEPVHSDKIDSKLSLRSPAKFKPTLNITKSKQSLINFPSPKRNDDLLKQKMIFSDNLESKKKSDKLACSPKKRSPLSQNNSTCLDETEVSVSYFRDLIKKESDNIEPMEVTKHESDTSHSPKRKSKLSPKNDSVIKMEIENIEPKRDIFIKPLVQPVSNAGFVYKEDPVRKKADKLALPGWGCDECKNYYGEMYKDDPGMLQQKMNECSKHRSRFDPSKVRKEDSPNFWQIRMNVPENTEELNRMNGVL